MAQQPDHHASSLLNEVEHEVSKENSPFLHVITKHSRLIAGAIVCFILAIGAYWMYDSYRQRNELATQKEFGDIVTTKQGQERMDAIKAFIAKTPAKFHFNAYLAQVQTAQEANKQEEVLAAWEAIAKLQPSFGLEAALGKASALAGQNKLAEAVQVLQATAAELAAKKDAPENKGALAYLYNRIGILAELAGNKPAAVEAYKQLLSMPKDPTKNMIWEQKIASLSREMK
ncbi:hypothetical protein [Desulfovibrio cuneatus]|uniref:hypothetical protein n=1 Tax=Desulfovibrio cuneatus TaxID=159728 RepID=UPI0003F531C8|nr:hypothetical protein [Desulfovibrio cuneatus]